MHPHLDFNLLRAQMDACKEIDIKVPVYLTGGVNNRIAGEYPEWQRISPEGVVHSPFAIQFHGLCFNSPYLDYLSGLIEETVTLFPDADGIFLDIINQGQCCCKWCMNDMQTRGFNPESPADRIAFSNTVLQKYYRSATAAARVHNPKMRVFHNSGHIQCGKTDILQYFSHLELESLPTGGWGYDHFPVSAAYARKLPLDFLGMTGKFHTTWGEFGGYKHPNALLYECSAMLAYGAKCSIGDQLHPNGQLDSGTYRMIGKAYKEVEQKEPWCDGAISAANIAILSSSAVNGRRGCGKDESTSEIGAARILLEGHIHFDLIDQNMDFMGYSFLILPDDIPLDKALQKKLEAFLRSGGKLIMSGKSGLTPDDKRFALDIGAEFCGISESLPDYVLPIPEYCPSYIEQPMVMYHRSLQIKLQNGQTLGQVYKPYFNRTYNHFCSHQHAPCMDPPSGFDAGVKTEKILYFAHPVFSIYREYGATAHREYVLSAVKDFMGRELQVITNLPSQGRLTLMEQPDHKRYILHLLYAPKILRGGSEIKKTEKWVAHGNAIEVIENLTPLHNIEVEIKVAKPIQQVVLEPQGENIPFSLTSCKRIHFTIKTLSCHQMVTLIC